MIGLILDNKYDLKHFCYSKFEYPIQYGAKPQKIYILVINIVNLLL